MNAGENISKQLLSAAVNASHEGIVVIDARQSGFPQIYVNHGFESLTGYASAEIVGKKFRVFHADDDHQSELAVIRSALAKGIGRAVTLRDMAAKNSPWCRFLQILTACTSMPGSYASGCASSVSRTSIRPMA